MDTEPTVIQQGRRRRIQSSSCFLAAHRDDETVSYRELEKKRKKIDANAGI